MWTNIFRIGGLHQISWFQFLPNDSDVTSLPDISARAGQRDAATHQVLSSHLQLQKEGFLSSWTNSFVGPWDPSQGTHNPDEKIKLWLFLPGRYLSIPETAQTAASGLRVIASGLWVSPGDSEEVATALSQALKNRLERALMELSYVRFGNVFLRYRSSSHNEELFRKGQPTIEFVFAASEDAIFVHAVLSAKHVRTLSGGDIEKVMRLSSNNTGQRFPAIVSPHGMRGSVTGCCSNELVKHVFIGSSTSITGLVGLPYPVPQAPGCKLQGHNCYIEVSLGCNMPNFNPEKSYHPTQNTPSSSRSNEKGSGDATACEKTFVYPYEAVLVPVLKPSYPRSLKRFWLHNWTGMSLASSTLFMYCDSKTDDVDDSWSESDGIYSRHGFNSSSNSNTSSVSSICSSSSDSDCITKATFGDLEADADSLNGRQSGLSSFTSMETNGPKQGLKRPRTGLDNSLVQAGGAGSAPTHDCDNSDITGIANDQIGSQWDWDDDDAGVGMDIQALLSEFGDFGDFFVNDSLPFGEPPGTAESQTQMFSGQEYGDREGSPTATAMDVSDQNLLPVGFQTTESFQPPTSVEECVSTVQEATKCTTLSGLVSCAPAVSTGEAERVMKAEALLSFAPEYGAVDTSSELSSTIFKSPYQPKSQKAESLNSCGNAYVYGATPPSSPGANGREENHNMAIDSRLHTLKYDTDAVFQKFYTQIAKGENPVDKKCKVYNNTVTSSERSSMSLVSSINSAAATNSCQNMASEVVSGSEHLLLSRRIVPASELECLIFQASMRRIRHTLVSVGNSVPTAWNRSVSQVPGDSDSILDNMSTKYESRKKEPIPIRIAGDVDGGILDGSCNAPIGVWRSVGAPKHPKPSNMPTTEAFSLSHHTFSEETVIASGKRQSLKDFVNAIPLLVQQAVSFVDLTLDGEFVDGPYGWLSLQEQRRRGFCCGPHMAHAGCGGILASCHSFDIAGVDLLDPISADVQASSVIGLLQSDMKVALKSAFGTADGPLSVIDWCKGRSQSVDGGTLLEALSAESSVSDYRDSSNTAATSLEDPLSPPLASVSMSSGLRDGGKGDDSSQRRPSQEHCISESEQQLGSRKRATLSVIPYPSILVGYQDDWLKTSASSLQHWEKVPLEPYAFQKHMSYYVVCPNIDSLPSAAADFFQQLGTVYETCKLGNHTPHTVGNQMDVDTGKCSTSGFLLLDSPRSIKVESNTASLVGSLSDYFHCLSNDWDLASFLKSLSKVLKTLQLGSCFAANAKEENSSPCTVIYVVCPFPDSTAVLQTIIESSIALASSVYSSDNDKRSTLYSHVGKALSYAAGVDEASISNIPAISGFSIPKLVLQVVPIDAVFRVTSPSINEIVLLKEMAFTVYNKARRLSRGSSNGFAQSSTFSDRSNSSIMQMGNPVPGMWKDCVGSRISGTSLTRGSDLDPGIRAGTWDNTWQNSRAVGLGSDSNRAGDSFFQEEIHLMFEPLFILAEPGSVEQGVTPTFTGNLAMELSKQMSDDSSVGHTQSLCGDTGPGSQLDGSEGDGFGSSQQRPPPSLHCCYGWTEDWRWLVCVWTDSRGELLDSHIFPFGGISSRQDTKGMQNLFVQVLHQGCQLLQACSSPDNGVVRSRDFVITRIGCFYELECQEWQKALYFIGGPELKKWPLQLRRTSLDSVPSNSNGATLQQQELDRSLPSSPNPLYSPHSKSAGIMKGGLGQTNSRKQLLGGPAVVDGSTGPLQWVQSISFVSISVDHSLRLVSQADVSTGTSQGSQNYLEGFTPVKSLGCASASYIIAPGPTMRFLTPAPLQLPTCLTSESPPLAHLLHSKGYAIPLSTGFTVSKAVPSLKKDSNNIKDEWPSVLSVSLVDYFGGYSEKRVTHKQQGGRNMVSDARDNQVHVILESVASELQALSWMTASPAYLDRRSALPFHCDAVLRLRRLLHFADHTEKS
ncbi:mediator of RNA polymerase II transcription subunit 13 [Silene latifolia]|uniref:mediator of RNA polymerase II transcription subunit 13 n=1 Tax=Silene latifolia TaxID=37657 RepID=UPI003D770E0F